MGVIRIQLYFVVVVYYEKPCVALQDECADHCLSYALSDVKDPETCDPYELQCEHNHDRECGRCQKFAKYA